MVLNLNPPTYTHLGVSVHARYTTCVGTLAKTGKQAKLRRRRCDNCNALFQPTSSYPVQRFCQKACRFEFHKHGSAFGPLKIKLEKLTLKTVREETAKLRAELKALTLKLDSFIAEHPAPSPR